MASNTIGNIHIELGANTVTYKRDLNRARMLTHRATGRMTNSFRGMEHGITRTLSVVGRLRGGLFAAAGVGGMVLLGKRSLQTADAIAKTADKVGVSVEALQELRFAAEQAAGVTGDTLDMALQRFSRRLGEAAQGSGELAGTLKQYGIDARNADGNTRAVTDVLGELADKIKNAESSQEKLRISFKAFDSEGAALVNLMNLGSDGLARYRNEAQRAGAVLNEGLVRSAERANEELGRMTRVISTDLTTALLSIREPVLYGTGLFRDLGKTFTWLTDRFRDFENQSSSSLQGSLASLNSQIAEKIRVLSQISQQPNVLGLQEIMNRKEVKSINGDIAELESQARRIEAVIESRKRSSTASGSAIGPARITITKGNGTREMIDSIKRRGDAIKFETMLIGKSLSEKAKLGALEGAMITARRSNVVLSKTHIGQLQAEAARVGVLTGTLEGLERTQRRNAELAGEFGSAFVSNMERAAAEGGKLSGVLKGLALDFTRIYARRQMQDGIESLISGKNIGSLFGSMTSRFGGGGGAGVPRQVLGFASGGDHGGGLRLVGERGPELEATGPSRIFNASKTREMLSGGGGNTYYIDARGQDPAVVQNLERALLTLAGPGVTERRSVGAVVDARQRNPRLFS